MVCSQSELYKPGATLASCFLCKSFLMSAVEKILREAKKSSTSTSPRSQPQGIFYGSRKSATDLSGISVKVFLKAVTKAQISQFVNGGDDGASKQDGEENLLSVLDKSLGVGINQNVQTSQKLATVLIYPKLEEKTFLLDFKNLAKIIKAGKKEAIKKIPELKKMSNPQKFALAKEKKMRFRNQENSFHLKKVDIQGNENLSKKTIFSMANSNESKL